jgi:hypothetical protein
MIIRGEAGVGKSALLAEAGRVGAAAGMRVLAATGIAAEARVAFAALHTLLSPLLDKADLLPGPQRRALLTAFGVDEVEAPSPLRIGLAALNLMAHAAADHPVLALADDVHWFDDESAQVLLFVARRVNGHPIVLLAGTRDGSTDRFRVPTSVRCASKGWPRRTPVDCSAGGRRISMPEHVTWSCAWRPAIRWLFSSSR